MVGAFGLLGVAGFAWLAGFQVLLAAGVLRGDLAWGGKRRSLPPTLRAASLLVACIALFGMGVIVQAADWSTLLPDVWITPLLFFFGALFALSLVGNAMSTSRIEQIHGVALTIVLTVSCLGLALLR